MGCGNNSLKSEPHSNRNPYVVRSNSVDTANRKLIRPNLNGAKEQISSNRSQKPRTAPLDQTHAESFYYL